ncbi:MAG: hypothetical protein R3B60_03990 [Candidatus Paceibacterota bacterium]
MVNTNLSENRQYIIKSPYWQVRDGDDNLENLDQLHFHVQAGDYFSTLATILGFVEEMIMEQDTKNAMAYELKVLRQVKKDLLYLNANFDIKAKERDCK